MLLQLISFRSCISTRSPYITKHNPIHHHIFVTTTHCLNVIYAFSMHVGQLNLTFYYHYPRSSDSSITHEWPLARIMTWSYQYFGLQEQQILGAARGRMHKHARVIQAPRHFVFQAPVFIQARLHASVRERSKIVQDIDVNYKYMQDLPWQVYYCNNHSTILIPVGISTHKLTNPHIHAFIFDEECILHMYCIMNVICLYGHHRCDDICITLQHKP